MDIIIDFLGLATETSVVGDIIIHTHSHTGCPASTVGFHWTVSGTLLYQPQQEWQVCGEWSRHLPQSKWSHGVCAKVWHCTGPLRV